MVKLNALRKDTLAIQEILDFVQVDAAENQFSVVDKDWSVFNSLVHIYKAYPVQQYLRTMGICITINDIDDKGDITELVISYDESEEN